MASKAQIYEEFKNLSLEVQQLVEANKLKLGMLPDEDPTEEAWKSLMYLKGYQDALSDAADCFTRTVDRLKTMPDD